jgi:hypothetical protein
MNSKKITKRTRRKRKRRLRKLKLKGYINECEMRMFKEASDETFEKFIKLFELRKEQANNN